MYVLIGGFSKPHQHQQTVWSRGGDEPERGWTLVGYRYPRAVRTNF
jgi:hypothetical protein